MQKYKTLEEFFSAQTDEKLAQIDVLRSLILETEPTLQEHLKWNAPSYVLDGEDRITFNLMNKQGDVKLVFHMGATRKEDRKAPPILNDETGLIEWVSDIRGMATFESLDDVTAKKDRLKTVIKKWLSL